MIHIHLDDSLLNNHKIYAQSDSQLTKDLQSLQSKFTNHISQEILKFVFLRLEDIISCKFKDLKDLQKDYINLISNLVNLSSNTDILQFKNTHNSLYDVFVKAYDNFTSKGIYISTSLLWNSHYYIKELDQIICPYCNANFIQTVQANKALKNAGLKARADLDHFIPKSIFPIFAITLSNLIPSCIYCNQRFKRNHDTNLQNYFSPFDSNIEKNFKFKIRYDLDDFTSAYDKLEVLTENIITPEESDYRELLLKIKYFSDIENYKSASREYNNQLKDTIQNIANSIDQAQLCSENLTQLEELLNQIKLKSNEFHNQIEIFHEKDILTMLNNIDYYYDSLLAMFKKFLKLYQDFKDIEDKKGHNSIKKSLTEFKNKAQKILEKINSTFNPSSTDYFNETHESGNFTDVALGESTKYNIEIVATSDNLDDQRRVYHNVALFQLEAVYNQFKPYINKKIKQSYIVNDLYQEQLKSQFPNLLTDNFMNNTLDLILINSESIRYEILGKLTYDIILPTIQYKNHKDILKLI